MNKGFWIGFVLGLLAEIVRLVAGSHRREQRRVMWDVWVLLPTFLAFSFMTGASIEWINDTNSTHLGEFVICALCWVSTLWAEKIIETNDWFLEECWHRMQKDVHYSRSAYAYSAAMLFSGIPYVAFSHVLGVEPWSLAWWYMTAGGFSVMLISFLLMRYFMCRHIEEKERSTAREIILEMMRVFAGDRVNAVNIDGLDKLIAERRPAQRDALERNVGILEKTIYFAHQFEVASDNQLVPGLRDIRLAVGEIKEIAERETADMIAAMRLRYYILTILVGPEEKLEEAKQKLIRQFPERQQELGRLLDYRGRLRTS